MKLLSRRTMAQIGEAAAGMTRAQMRAGLGVDGQPAAPRADGSRGPIVQSGGLVDSIQVIDTQAGEAIVGSDLRYARFVDDARPVIGLSPRNADTIAEMLTDECDAAIEALL